MFKKSAKALMAAAMATSIMALVASPASALTIEVSQETALGLGNFNSNVLGFINPFNTGLTAGAFYQYGSPNGASYNGELNGGPTPVSSKTQLFFVNASNGLGFFMIHDRAGDGSGGRASMRFDLTGDTANIAGDEAGEVASFGGGTGFIANHRWFACCTDGARIGALDGSGWELFAKFNSQSPPIGINGWGAIDSSGSVVQLLFSPYQVRFRPVPEPGTLALFGLGLVGLGYARRKKAA